MIIRRIILIFRVSWGAIHNKGEWLRIHSLNLIWVMPTKGSKMKYLIFSTLFIIHLFNSQFIHAQESRLSGVVLDDESGEVVIGASVMSGEFGVSTDANGEFTLKYYFGDTLQIQMMSFPLSAIRHLVRYFL